MPVTENTFPVVLSNGAEYKSATIECDSEDKALTIEESGSHPAGAGVFLEIAGEAVWLGVGSTRALIAILEYCVRNAE